MGKIFGISLLAIFLYIPLTCLAQDIVPVIHLSPEETTEVSQSARALQDARARDAKARTASQTFYGDYQAAHPNLGSFSFSTGFRSAVGEAPVPAAGPVTVIPLSADEQNEAAYLHRELLDGAISLKRAEKNWTDCQHEVAADHVATNGPGEQIKLPDGKTVKLPYVWSGALAFSTDFRLAFPRGAANESR